MNDAELVGAIEVAGERVWATGHAVKAYRERIRPALDLDAALNDLQRMAGSIGALREERPAWKAENSKREDDDREALWLYVGDDVAMPVRRQRGRLVAITCVARGSLSPERRRRRHERRARRRARHYAPDSFTRRSDRPARTEG